VLLNAALRTGDFDRAEGLTSRLLNSTGAARKNAVIFARQMEARIWLYRGKARQAEGFFRQAIFEQDQLHAAPNGYTEPLRRIHGETLLHMGRNAEALAVLRATSSNQRELTGAQNNSALQVTHVLLGCALARLGDLTGARVLWMQAHPALLRDLGANNPYTLAAEAYVALSDADPVANFATRKALALRVELELGWQVAAPELVRWLRQPTGPPDWQQLPVVL
jgi:tetratricopeptide (TPR) repeat protein